MQNSRPTFKQAFEEHCTEIAFDILIHHLPLWALVYSTIMGGDQSFERETGDAFEAESLLQSIPHPAPLNRPSLRYLLLSFITAALVLSVAIGVDIYLRVRWQAQYPFGLEHRFQCGESAAEAKALGCIFELMTVSWVPPECHDEELNQEFRSVRDWHFYKDLEGSQEIGEAELSEMTVLAFGTNEFHRMHCGYSWMKMHRALKRGGRIEAGISYYKHTTHCADMYRPANMSAIGTDVRIGYQSC